jgi:hypothetical protein
MHHGWGFTCNDPSVYIKMLLEVEHCVPYNRPNTKAFLIRYIIDVSQNKSLKSVQKEVLDIVFQCKQDELCWFESAVLPLEMMNGIDTCIFAKIHITQLQ